MAHLVTGYAGVEHITSADQGSFNAAFAGNGQFVMDVGSKYSASITSNNNVRVLDGDLLMYGRHIRINPNEYEDLTIQTGTAGKNRVDLICMTYEKNASDGTEIAYLEVLKGTETEGTPAAPTCVNGNILNGATKNQMPLYKATIQGVVLKNLTKLFSVVSTFKDMASQYEKEFQEACETYLDSLQIKDSLTSILENTSQDQIAGALGVKELADVSLRERGSYTGSLDSLDAGVWRVDLSECTNTPISSGDAIVICIPYNIQICYVYSGNAIKQVFSRFGQTIIGISVYGNWSVTCGANTLTQSGVEAFLNRATIVSGGYFISGNMCYVNIEFKITWAMSANNYWVTIKGFPTPVNNKNALSITNQNYNLGEGVYISKGNSSGFDGRQGELIIATKDAISANNNYAYVVSGWYMLE